MRAVKPSIAAKYILLTLTAGLVPMVHGSPGIGKSEIVHQIAREFNLELIDVRLSQSDPTDLNGLIHNKGNKAGYLPMETFPIKGDKLPKGKNGWLIFLDEINSAPRSVQAASYKLTQDRMVGQNKLHEDVAIVCAGNLDTDNAIVNAMGTAMQSRLVHMELTVDSKDWLKWANKNRLDHRIISYISYRPNSLHLFDPDHSDKTFACPRTWHKLSKLLTEMDELSYDYVPLMEGTVGDGAANEFFQFSRVFDSLPDIRDIIANPMTAGLPNEPSSLYAMTGVLAEQINESNTESVLDYLERLPKEFQVLSIRNITNRFPKITANERFFSKASEVAELL